MRFNDLSPNPKARPGKKRVGRGHGSGHVKTAGKGTKGQKARTGHHGIPKPGFEGGQTAMARRLPKRGFINPFRKEVFAVNLGDIATRFTEAGAAVDLAALKAAGLVPRSAKHVKVLGSIADNQKLTQKLAVHAHFISASAKEKLEAAGGAFHAIQVKASKQATPA